MIPFDIDLGFIAIALAPGHPLRVAISSSNFDRWDINPLVSECIHAQPLGQQRLRHSEVEHRTGDFDPKVMQEEFEVESIGTLISGLGSDGKDDNAQFDWK